MTLEVERLESKNTNRFFWKAVSELPVSVISAASAKGRVMQGTVKFYNSAKGYGFITPEDGSKDIFVHISAVEQSGLSTLAEGQAITFEVEPDRKGKGPKAISLQVS